MARPSRSIPSVNNNEISNSSDNSSKIFKDIDYFVLRDNNDHNVEVSDPRVELSVSSIISSTRDQLVHNVGRRFSVDITMEEQDERISDSEGNSEGKARAATPSIGKRRIDEMFPPLPDSDKVQLEKTVNPIPVDSAEGSDVRGKGSDTSSRVRPRIVLTSQAKRRAVAELQCDALSSVCFSIPSENFELLDKMEALSLQESEAGKSDAKVEEYKKMFGKVMKQLVFSFAFWLGIDQLYQGGMDKLQIGDLITFNEYAFVSAYICMCYLKLN
ncbi:hypothetical protein BUALT_Bualt12G0091600 [Buddleja alternifolia]|uniref:Calcium uniporter protein n=1 Tax=Buddleja alternifolia TaxID=168488 RepID=A0AAV6WR53_9LAMI|nr:hypothetical protein BUALT_Bualt12G0091600 [Buddleja alternifolia]